MVTPENNEVEEPETEEVEEDTEQDENEDEYVPPTRDEFIALQKQLTKVNNESKKHRLALKAAKDAAAPADQDDISKARTEVENKYRPMIVKSAVRGELISSGAQGSVDKLLKLIDTSDFDIDDDGNVDSDQVEDAINSLKEDFPQLFTKPRPGRVDSGRQADGGAKKVLTASERQAAAALGH